MNISDGLAAILFFAAQMACNWGKWNREICDCLPCASRADGRTSLQIMDGTNHWSWLTFTVAVCHLLRALQLSSATVIPSAIHGTACLSCKSPGHPQSVAISSSGKARLGKGKRTQYAALWLLWRRAALRPQEMPVDLDSEEPQRFRGEG